MKKIIFVCDGNTCRSPMAGAILRKKLKETNLKISVSSYGLYAENGKHISENAKIVLNTMDIKVGGFRSKRLKKNDVTESFAVITMTEKQKEIIGAKNVLCAKDFIGIDIPDPYGKNIQEYTKTADIITLLCDKIIKELSK